MKVLKLFFLLFFVGIFFFISCKTEPEDESGPPEAVVAAFVAVRDSALGPVNTQLKTEDTTGSITWGPEGGLSYSGDLTIDDTIGGGNSLLEYVLTITASNVSYSGYTITGAVDMTMTMTVDSNKDLISGSLTLNTSNGGLTLTGGEISTITVTDVEVSMTTGAATGTITFDGVAYSASDFSFR